MGGANDTATDAVRLQDRIAVPGWSHLAMQTEAVAVMIHVLGGVAEHRNARDPRSDALVGQTLRTCWRRPLAVLKAVVLVAAGNSLSG
jgi:hypothetical protein